MIVYCLTTNLSKTAVDSDVKVSGIDYYYQAIDIIDNTNQNTFRCLLENGISTAFIRVYQSNGNGFPDPNSITNIYNAAKEGLGTEVYVEPQPRSTKSGNEQFMEAYTFLKNNDIMIRSIWIKITLPVIWPNNQNYNVEFINQFVTYAWRYNLTVGIYTNWYDWQQITGGWSDWSIQGQIRLWYWNMIGSDWNGATCASFDDYRSFGGFNVPFVKHYVQNIYICGIYASLSTYMNTISMKDSSANMSLEMVSNITNGFQ
ncbi:Lysozyme-like protein [Dirofilaria immitis]